MDSSSINQINRFPIPIADLRLIVFSKLDGVSLGRCQRVCKQFKGDIESEKCQRLWRDNFASEYGYLPAMPSAFDWRGFYIQQLLVRHNMAPGNFGVPVKLEGDVINVESSLTFGDKLYAYDAGMLSLCCFSLSTGKLVKKITEFSQSHELRSIDSNYFIIKYKAMNELNGFISIWDASKDECVFNENILGKMAHVEGTRVMFFTKFGNLQIFDFKSDQSIKLIHGGLCERELPKDSKLIGNLFFVLMNWGLIRVYDIKNGEQLYTVQPRDATHSKKMFVTDEHLVVINEKTYGLNGEAWIYGASNGKLIHKIELSGSLGALFAEMSQNHLISISPDKTNTLACWDLETGKIVKEFTPPAGVLFWFKIGVSNRLVIASGKSPGEFELTIWDIKNQTLLSDVTYKGFGHFRTWNNFIYLHCMDKISFWDMTLAKETVALSLDREFDSWHFDGARFIVGPRGDLQIYNLSTVPQQKSLASRIVKKGMALFGWK